MRRVGKDRFSAFQAGAMTLAVVLVACYFGFTKTNPFAERFELKAVFTTANQIKSKSPVRIAGVQVGRVKSVEALGERGALVTMELQDKGLPIHEDATAKIRPRIFLEGNYFVDIQPGSPSAKTVKEGFTVPITQTAAPVGFGRVLKALQTDTREDLRTLLQEYGSALSKGGAGAYNSFVRYWEDAFRDSAIVGDATRGILEHDLSEYIKGAGKVAQGLDRDPEALKLLVTSFAQTADALASEDKALERAIGILDDTLAQGRSAFTSLNLAFPPLRRLVAELRPATRAAKPALDAQLPLLVQLRGLVSKKEMLGLARELRPVVPELVELNHGGVALQEQTRALSSCQLTSIQPTAESKIVDKAHPANGKVYQEGVKWLPGIAGESRSFDANGQWIRTLAQSANYAYALGDGRFYFTGQPLQGVNPPADKDGHTPMRPDVPCETQEPPDLQTIPGAAPAAIKINRNTAAYRARAPKALARSLKWLRGQLVYEGLDKQWRVSSTPAKGASR